MLITSKCFSYCGNQSLPTTHHLSPFLLMPSGTYRLSPWFWCSVIKSKFVGILTLRHIIKTGWEILNAQYLVLATRYHFPLHILGRTTLMYSQWADNNMQHQLSLFFLLVCGADWKQGWGGIIQLVLPQLSKNIECSYSTCDNSGEQNDYFKTFFWKLF